MAYQGWLFLILFVFSGWMKVMSSACFRSTLTFLVSLSISQFSADQSGHWYSSNWVFVSRSLIAYAKYNINSSVDKQSPWHNLIAVPMSSPILSSNLTYKVMQFTSKCIICSFQDLYLFKVINSVKSFWHNYTPGHKVLTSQTKLDI